MLLRRCQPIRQQRVWTLSSRSAGRRAKFSENPDDSSPHQFKIADDVRLDVDLGIVHLGVGRFFRAHQAVYIDDVLRRGDTRWAICGVCMLPQDEKIFEALSRQHGEYNVIEMDQTSTAIKQINSMTDILFGHKNPEDVIHTLLLNSIKIVTMTVTEAGYFYLPSSKMLDFSHPSVKHDFELFEKAVQYYCSQNPGSEESALHPHPKTIYGYLSLGLMHRYLNKVKPFTVMSCDNIQGNGDLARSLLLEFCGKVKITQLKRPGKFKRFLNWLNKHVAFPNSMVDRITPAASKKEVDFMRYPMRNFADDVPVSCESYRQWVIENKFCNTKPKWEKLKNVLVVDSVEPYEKIKIRCLNGGHCALGFAGVLAGIETICDATLNETLQSYLREYFKEVTVTLERVPDINIEDYQDTLISRFSNDQIKDDVYRICKDGSSKIPGFILPTVVEVLEKEAPSKSLSFLIASWIAFIEHQKEKGARLDDAEESGLFELVDRMSGDVKIFLGDRRLFGDLSQKELFVSQVQHAYSQIKSLGVEEALKNTILSGNNGAVI